MKIKNRLFRVLFRYMPASSAFLLFAGTIPSLTAAENDTAVIRKMGYPYYTGEIIPKPKEANFEDAFIRLADIGEGKNNTCILMGRNPAIQERTAAEQLQKRLNMAFSSPIVIPVITEGNELPSGCDVIISIGTPSSNSLNAGLCAAGGLKVSEKFPGVEGYALFNTTNQGKTVFVCCGSDSLGSYYAVQSLNQLVTVKDRKLIVRKAHITDWPDCLRRTAGASTATDEAFEWMGSYKLNNYNLLYSGSKYWFNLLPECRKGSLDMCRKATQSGIIKYNFMINPYTPYHNPGDKNNRKIKISDDSDMQALIAHYRMFLEAGASSISLDCDDFVWTENLEFVLNYPEDKARFKDVAESHIYMANTVYSTLAKDYPDLQMYITPSYYAEKHVISWTRDPELGKTYLKKLAKGLLPQIKISLTGPQVLSPVITTDDIIRIKKYLGGREWYLWDNTGGLYYTDRCGSQKPYGIFRPFKSKFPNDFILSHTRMFNSAICAVAWTERVRITQISIADYLWNQKAYDPEWSLRQAIESYAGPGMAPLLIRFGDLYADVDKSIAEVNAGGATALEPGKIVFEDSFEGSDLSAKSGPAAWDNYDAHMNVRLEKSDARDGKQCVVSESRQKGYLLRSGDKTINLQMADLQKYAIDFFWKTSDPKTSLRICLMANGGKDAYLQKCLNAANTEWNHYHIPLTDFSIVESPQNQIKEITGIRFHQNDHSEQAATFKIDKVCISENSGAQNEKTGQRFDAIEKLKACFKEIEASCWNKRLLNDIKTRLFEPKIKIMDRLYNKPSIKIKNVEKAPLIDGKLDDECWRNAEKTSLFKAVDGNREITATWAVVAHDKENLYIAFTCKANVWDEDSKLATGRDSSIGNNDSIEIFIEPSIGSGEYFHLGANRAGGTMDQKRGKKKIEGIPQTDTDNTGRKWNPEWEVKAFKDNGAWTAEIRIPFSSLDRNPAKGETWGLNLCRSYAPGQEFGAWSCTYGGFHSPLFFGRAVFE